MKEPQPGNLTASRIATLPSGIVAEVVVNEQADAFGRWFSGGAWSAWRPVAEGVRDVSITPDADQEDPAALISAVVFVPLPPGAMAVRHIGHESAFFRLAADGVTPADL